MKLRLTVHRQSQVREIDTGAFLFLINEKTYLSAWTDSNKPPTTHKSLLKIYTGKIIPVLRSLQVEVSHHNQAKQFSFKRQIPTLLISDWTNVLTLDWHNIHCMQNNHSLDKLLQKFKAIFVDELDKLVGIYVMDMNTHPKLCKARSIPLALQKKVVAVSDKLEGHCAFDHEKLKFMTGKHLL